MSEVALGERCRDTATGYEGIAVARTERWHGPTQIAIERCDANGAPQEQWFYEARVELVEASERRPGF